MAEGDSRATSADAGIRALLRRLDPEDDGLLQPAPLRAGDAARFRFRLPEDYVGVARDLLIGIPTHFPKAWPDFRVEPDPGTLWPHVLRGGACLFGLGQRAASLEPEALINDCVNRFHQLMGWVLRGADPAARDAEFHRELVTYWQTQLSADGRPLQLLRRPEASTALFSLSAPKGDGLVRAELLAEDTELLADGAGQVTGRRERMRTPVQGAFYARLVLSPTVGVPPPGEIFTWAARFLPDEDARELEAWAKLTAALPLRWLLVELPGTTPIQVVAFAIRRADAQPRSQPHYGRRGRAWRGPPVAMSVGTVRLSRVDVLAEDVIFSRNPEESLPMLRGAHALLVGAGCLGSMVARHLLRAGVGTLTILDPQLFGAENLGRHELGVGALSQFKAEALAARFRADSRLATIHALTTDLETAMGSPERLFAGVDIVVVTTADPASEMSLWQYKAATSAPWALVHGWAERDGFAAHALVAPSGPFDARCLFDALGEFRFAFTHWPNRGWVATAACGTGYIPAGPLAIGSAASLVANAVVHSLADAVLHPTWHYVVNDPDRVASRGGRYDGPQRPPGCTQWTNVVAWPTT